MQGECPLVRVLDAIPYIFDIKVDEIVEQTEHSEDRPQAILEAIRDVLFEESGIYLTFSTIFYKLAETGRFVDEDEGCQKMVSELIMLEAEEERERDQAVNEKAESFMTAPRLRLQDLWRRAVQSTVQRSRIPAPKNPSNLARSRPVW